MLPDVDADDREMRDERVLVRGRCDLETLALRVHALQVSSSSSVHPQQMRSKYALFTHKPAPSTSLNRQRRSIELLLEVVNAAPRLVDRILERSRSDLPAIAALIGRRREVLPEQRVVDVSCTNRQ